MYFCLFSTCGAGVHTPDTQTAQGDSFLLLDQDTTLILGQTSLPQELL